MNNVELLIQELRSIGDDNNLWTRHLTTDIEEGVKQGQSLKTIAKAWPDSVWHRHHITLGKYGLYHMAYSNHLKVIYDEALAFGLWGPHSYESCDWRAQFFDTQASDIIKYFKCWLSIHNGNKSTFATFAGNDTYDSPDRLLVYEAFGKEREPLCWPDYRILKQYKGTLFEHMYLTETDVPKNLLKLHSRAVHHNHLPPHMGYLLIPKDHLADLHIPEHVPNVYYYGQATNILVKGLTTLYTAPDTQHGNTITCTEHSQVYGSYKDRITALDNSKVHRGGSYIEVIGQATVSDSGIENPKAAQYILVKGSPKSPGPQVQLSNKRALVETKGGFSSISVVGGTVIASGGSCNIIAKGDAKVEASGKHRIQAYQDTHITAKGNNSDISVTMFGYSRLYRQGSGLLRVYMTENSSLVVSKDLQNVRIQNMGKGSTIYHRDGTLLKDSQGLFELLLKVFQDDLLKLLESLEFAEKPAYISKLKKAWTNSDKLKDFIITDIRELERKGVLTFGTPFITDHRRFCKKLGITDHQIGPDQFILITTKESKG